ncbi:uncharacterized protein BYT42DRAFT_615192 [Radiomyces spectabilis]|uniref:uncharacterized protein n=1 Tax=Radiomyces spectabilis TaxID=64574 RepID=UPI00222119B8|nr:uncharacterized protein BYT42DRAFT_615192 [Radiomyces spectabilis]KAI8376459.1 hypothetical protein BYT42DRAFT_615192 [Radiomyces spectabilis]
MSKNSTKGVDTTKDKISYPVNTEEPVRRKWLKTELEDINKVDENDHTAPPDESEDEEEEAEEPEDLQNKIQQESDTESVSSDEEEQIAAGADEVKKDNNQTIVSAKPAERPTPKSEDVSPDYSQMDLLWGEMERIQERQNIETNRYEHDHPMEQEELWEEDPELLERTESNRHIPVPQPDNPQKKDKSLRNRSQSLHRRLLVFAEPPCVVSEPDRIVVTQVYGVGPTGKPSELEGQLPKRKSRAYFVACDFSKESFYAIEWTMGTMMRDGDELHVATVLNREDNPDTSGMTVDKELEEASHAVTDEAKKMLSQMMLFDIKLHTYAIIGRVKSVLKKLIKELHLTMVVCGSRGRGTVKGLLMGSISTYLVHKSAIPVTVIRPQKKKKKSKQQYVEAVPLSESMRSGNLHVDEVA